MLCSTKSHSHAQIKGRKHITRVYWNIQPNKIFLIYKIFYKTHITRIYCIVFKNRKKSLVTDLKQGIIMPACASAS